VVWYGVCSIPDMCVLCSPDEYSNSVTGGAKVGDYPETKAMVAVGCSHRSHTVAAAKSAGMRVYRMARMIVP
jgi:hypothetical protein